MRARTLALAAALLLLVPAALAHLAFDRPTLQPAQPPRSVDASIRGTGATVLLLSQADPLRNSVRVDLDPAKGVVALEHRPDPPQREDAFTARIDLGRIVEYRDMNADGVYAPDVDTPVKSWRFASQPWRPTPVQNATLGGAKAKAIGWSANLTNAPRLNLTVGATGLDVVDEGARARPQDVLLYLDVAGVPPRGVGNLHVLEGSVTAPSGSTLHEVLAPANETVGFHVDGQGRRAFLLWGGQATVDDREQNLRFTHAPPVDEGGNVTWDFRIHFPLMDREAHVVLVAGLEYAPPPARTPAPDAAWAALAAALAGLLLGRRARRA